MTLDTQYEFRSRMVEALTRDIIGPQAEDEVLRDFPLQTYISGILYPRSSEPIEPNDDIDVDDDDDNNEGQFDPAVAYANLRYPSSMGLTFAIDPSIEAIQVEIRAARYEQTEGEDALGTGLHRMAAAPDGAQAVGADQRRRTTSWRRVAIGPVNVTLDVAARKWGAEAVDCARS